MQRGEIRRAAHLPQVQEADGKGHRKDAGGRPPPSQAGHGRLRGQGRRLRCWASRARGTWGHEGRRESRRARLWPGSRGDLKHTAAAVVTRRLQVVDDTGFVRAVRGYRGRSSSPFSSAAPGLNWGTIENWPRTAIDTWSRMAALGRAGPGRGASWQLTTRRRAWLVGIRGCCRVCCCWARRRPGRRTAGPRR